MTAQNVAAFGILVGVFFIVRWVAQFIRRTGVYPS